MIIQAVIGKNLHSLLHSLLPSCIAAMSADLASEVASESPSVSATVNPKQEQILQGAMQVFLRSGYAGTSMDRVAAEAGVAKQTIYSHFQDKQGLFKALMERITIERFINLIYADYLDHPPAELLHQIAEIYLTRIADDPYYLALLRLIIAESERFPELTKLYTQTVIQRGRALFSHYFTAHPEFGIIDPEAIAHIFLGSLVSYVIVQEVLYGKEVMPLERDRLVNNLVQLVLSLIQVQGKG
jgi:AcrR family transcriptional regulator